MQNTSERTVTRVRHTLKFRLLQVLRVHTVTPHLLRVTLGGADLADFESASFDDHVKVFFPPPGAERPALPTLGANGPEFPEGEAKPAARDFTPRRFDRAACELDLEFVLNHPGPASQWAAQARVGQWLGIGGPRGSFVVPTDFDWHLLIGDDTALPAIARRLEELPAGARAAVVLEVADRTAQISFETRADVHEVWRFRAEADTANGDALVNAVRDLPLPSSGDGYVWAAGEALSMRAVRQHLTGERGIDKSRIRAAAYWKRGAAAVHETLED
ncbi:MULTISPECIES: siderophore-interacting protein [unclassified Burkholderia]|uniref:siderophore-interacting protein n=1 Tax=unclassified Burkholderia TaxID=2613784 RepID=UPI00084C2406|nr:MULTISPECIES: siderophore-interacting protein [unclassified Burkholderia]RQU05721.1 siderophore-interacting protein [Burkholderia cenocepacia]MBR8234984.1 siderophore-interacting protein [Burkholderia sp. AU32357]MBY4876475.1 siderophore-interacting protein [Burkholderia sp. AU42008]OED11800.1 NADPH-dependent ferric siderophore reductase [Burkholderia sp. A2]OXI39156.1 siderophore-interacting protein [Burkholderia sp. AU17457]